MVVIGAGLAGASTAAALAARGYEVVLLDRHAEPAAGSSGNPAGLFHATVHGDDSPYARLFRAAALHTARGLQALDPQRVPHGLDGLLRLEHDRCHAAMQALIDQQRLPPDFVQALDADAASRCAGVPLAAPAWFYPQGGWVSPGALVRQRLTTPGARFLGGAAVHRLRAAAGGWQCLDDRGRVLAEAPQLVLAVAEQVNPLLQALGWPGFALGRSRGQVSVFWPSGPVAPLRRPVAGSGYVLPLSDGRVLCGATTGDDDDDPRPRDDDHRANIARLAALCGLQAPADPTAWSGRVGWRVQAADKLPIAGPLAALDVRSRCAARPGPAGAAHGRACTWPVDSARVASRWRPCWVIWWRRASRAPRCPCRRAWSIWSIRRAGSCAPRGGRPVPGPDARWHSEDQ